VVTYRVGGGVGVDRDASVELEGAPLPLGALPSVLPLSVDGEAAGGCSRFRFSPTFPVWPESVQPAAAPASSASAKTAERAFFMVRAS
jgi:hypothetical protein